MTDRISASALPARAAQPREAIARAAERTGVDFNYLMAQASIESGLNPRAQARTSSASGLYQFIDQTWLATLDRHGEALGYGDMARAIETRGGRASVTDPAMRDAIMNLRFDPQASSLMAGALATDNRAALQGVLGRDPDASELYLAHFLGAAGASRFLSVLATDPDSSATALLPQAAAANRAIFNKPSGAPRSVQEVMGVIRAKVDSAMAFPGNPPTAEATASVQASRFPASFANVSASLPPSAPRASMADTLRDSFGLAGNGGEAPAHIRSAYARLEALGL
ncbi:transglycosylase SLT domain-containing protein [Aurantiacibacter poecillastricola]|uniref:transglycosylase SLT domain-containing protein n=1 Tax=Aurantiacibacter poecillastricola TaxID=3064385 RepID=UPI00273FA22A|nr:transglycosylase SLT domain-containing protein [Aurantiacibacter sp. 219JJ12-13]MDP5263103.1 transglycosylase SLT domain-containing protein [Aurantiacibacter sp. 219JJ12-13]